MFIACLQSGRIIALESLIAILAKIKCPLLLSSNVIDKVYRIPCDDSSLCYIGETKRALTLRLREHQANCRNQKQHSAVVDHSAIIVLKS